MTEETQRPATFPSLTLRDEFKAVLLEELNTAAAASVHSPALGRAEFIENVARALYEQVKQHETPEERVGLAKVVDEAIGHADRTRDVVFRAQGRR